MKKFALRFLPVCLPAAASLFFIGYHVHAAKGQVVPQPRNVKEEGGGGDVERGRYIVENVAMCGRCHTPHDDQDHADVSNNLMGAPILNRPPYWAVAAPRIAGSPPGTDAQVITLLSTGIARTGRPPMPPMPQFHMTRQDAQSVLAYLKSLRR